MTVTSTLMEIGDWQVDLDPATPGAILDRLADWYAFVTITAQRVPTTAVGGITRPLYRGIYLDRTGGYTIGGSDLAWYLGTPSDEPTQSSGSGPHIQMLWDGTNPVTKFLTDITAGTSLTGSRRTGTPTTMVVSGVNGSARTALDQVAVKLLGCEWRTRTDGVLELYTAAEATASPVAVIVDSTSGREPGSTLAAWHLSDTDPDLSVRDRRRSWITRANGSLTGAAGFAPGLPKGYGGVSLDIAGYDSVATDDGTEANDHALDELAKVTYPVSALSVTIDDYIPLAQLSSPDTLPGAAVAVHLPRLGVYDAANPMPWRGATIFPQASRVTEVTWPVTRGMGVYLDNTHQGGTITDLTDWVRWEAEDAGKGQATKLTLGALPRSVTGARRFVASA